MMVGLDTALRYTGILITDHAENPAEATVSAGF